MTLNVSAYENVFLEQQFCPYEGQCDVNYLEYVDVFLKRTAKSAITVIIMPIYEHVMNMLIPVEILAFEVPIERKSFRVLFRPEIFRPFSLLLYSSRLQN